MKLHVSGGSIVTACDALKIVSAASASGDAAALEVVLADTGRMPFGKAVALEDGAGRFLFVANDAAHFFALLASERAGKSLFGARDPRTDEWLAWEEATLQPHVAPLATAAVQGLVTFPLSSVAAPEGSAAPVVSVYSAYEKASEELRFLDRTLSRKAYLVEEVRCVPPSLPCTLRRVVPASPSVCMCARMCSLVCVIVLMRAGVGGVRV
jgi:hypothetical protein